MRAPIHLGICSLARDFPSGYAKNRNEIHTDVQKTRLATTINALKYAVKYQAKNNYNDTLFYNIFNSDMKPTTTSKAVR